MVKDEHFSREVHGIGWFDAIWSADTMISIGVSICTMPQIKACKLGPDITDPDMGKWKR